MHDRFILSQASAFSRDPYECYPSRPISANCDGLFWAPPVRFPSLQRSHSASRLLLVSIQAPPSSAFFRPLRVSSSPNPTVLFHTAHTLGILTLQGFPPTRTLPGSSPFSTFSAFLLRSEELHPRPQGFSSRVVPFLLAEYCIHTQFVTLLSFQPSLRFSFPRPVVTISSHSSAHDLSD